MAKYRSPDDRYIPALGIHVRAGEVFETTTKLGGPFEKLGPTGAKKAPGAKKGRRSKADAPEETATADASDGADAATDPTTPENEE